MSDSMTIHDIVFQIDIEAELRAIMTALTTADGIRGWWTGQITVESGVGGRLEPGFPSVPRTFDMKIVEATANRLGWATGQFPPPWQGTRVNWELMSNPEGPGTRVLFTHGGWQRDNPAIGMVALEWSAILRHLKKYAETGEPDPRAPTGAAYAKHA